MRINSEENVDVRFFGAHDRAWIPLKDVFLYSEEAPVVLKVISFMGHSIHLYPNTYLNPIHHSIFFLPLVTAWGGHHPPNHEK